VPRTIRTRLTLAFAGAFILLGAIVAMTYLSTQRLIQSNQQAQASIQRLLDLELKYADLQDSTSSDSLRAALDRISDTERLRVVAAGPQERERARTAMITITALSLVGLIVLGSLLVAVSHYTRDRLRALEELNQERRLLKERVQQRTAELEKELTHRHQAELARSQSEAQHVLAIEQIKDHAIFSISAEGKATSWNEGVRRVLGFEEEEFIGLPAERIFLPEDVKAQVPWRELAEAAENGVASNDRWMRRKDGTRFFANGEGTKVVYAVGEKAHPGVYVADKVP